MGDSFPWVNDGNDADFCEEELVIIRRYERTFGYTVVKYTQPGAFNAPGYNCYCLDIKDSEAIHPKPIASVCPSESENQVIGTSCLSTYGNVVELF